MQEVDLGMVTGPLTKQEAAQVCHCRPGDLCSCPMLSSTTWIRSGQSAMAPVVGRMHTPRPARRRRPQRPWLWGRQAAAFLCILYAVFPWVDWSFVFVADYAWLLRMENAPLFAVGICLLLLSLGVPLSWKKTLLAEVNTWLGFVINTGGSHCTDR